MTALGHCIQEWYHQQPPTYLLFIFCFYTDTFASKTAAVGDKYADASVGNVTGSNAVNVFLGIGVAWTIAAIYHAIHNQPFKVDPGNLGFSVTVFSVFAVFAISALMVRRKIPSIGGELGGPNNSKLLSSMCFVSLWFLYLILCSLEAYGFIEGFWGCCTKLSSCNSIQVPVFVLHPSATVGCGVFTVHASYAGRCDVPLRLREPDLPAHPEQYLCRKRFEDAISITLALLLARDINLTSRCPSLACFELFGSLQDGVSRWRQPSLVASTRAPCGIQQRRSWQKRTHIALSAPLVDVRPTLSVKDICEGGCKTVIMMIMLIWRLGERGSAVYSGEGFYHFYSMFLYVQII